MSAQGHDRGLMAWWRAGTPAGRRALVAGSLGWMLDSFDVMLYALVLAALMKDLGMAKFTAGLLGSATLVASAVGGLLFGVVADRYGRTRALISSILIYSVFTAACGFAQTVAQLAVFRVFLGLGMGGEWASGAALVSETWSAEHRGKALGFMQSAWAIGYGLAALVVAVVMPVWGWRAVFFVGVLPALLTVWVQRRVEEPALWRAARAAPPAGRGRLSDVFRGALGRLTVAVTLMNACTMFAWWGFNQWIPAYLSLPAAEGGIGLSTRVMSGFIIAMQVGMWFGYVTFGFISDRAGRRRAYVTYLVTAAVLMLAYAVTQQPAGVARARACGGVLRHRVLHRVRGRDGGDLPDRDPRHRAGLHLQRRAHRERHRAVGRRPPGRHARLRRGVLALRGRVCLRGRSVDLDSRNPRPRPLLTGGWNGRPAYLTVPVLSGNSLASSSFRGGGVIRLTTMSRPIEMMADG